MLPAWKIESKEGKSVLALQGNWRLAHLQKIPALAGSAISAQEILLSGKSLQEIDTAGAYALFAMLKQAGISPQAVNFADLRSEHRNILALVQEKVDFSPAPLPPCPPLPLEQIGRATMESLRYLQGLLSFFGETLLQFASAIARPRLFRLRELFAQLEIVCMNAIPIAALVTFLIGLVFAYLFASQSARFGANIFIVDAVSIAMCRELSPIIVAIIMAGRSGSAFTAQIGTMKLNEEVDALQTLGLSPLHVLVIPRVLALILAMPLLVFVGDVVGIAGGMIVANVDLGLTPTTFIDRLQVVLPVRQVLIGLLKAPVFAFFIAMIGCHMGLTVENNARSVGLHTTSTVVQSIVSVILLNAAFAVMFVELHL